MEGRGLRQIKLKPDVQSNFKMMAKSMSIELAELQDKALKNMITSYNKGKNITWRYPVGDIANVRPSESILDTVIYIAEEEEVSTPAVIYTALMMWSDRHNFES